MSDIQTTPNPRSSTLNRVLLGVVILLGVLIVAAFLTLVYGFVAGWNKSSTAQPAPAVADASSSTLQKLPHGATIIDMKVDSGRTIVRLKTPHGEEIDIYDTATGKLVTRIAPEP